MSNKGDLRVWWIPQIPMMPFTVEISNLQEGVKILNVLANYDLFQLAHNIKPDFSNAGGIEVYMGESEDNKEGWESWYDEETGEDDPEKYLLDKS